MSARVTFGALFCGCLCAVLTAIGVSMGVARLFQEWNTETLVMPDFTPKRISRPYADMRAELRWTEESLRTFHYASPRLRQCVMLTEDILTDNLYSDISGFNSSFLAWHADPSAPYDVERHWVALDWLRLRLAQNELLLAMIPFNAMPYITFEVVTAPLSFAQCMLWGLIVVFWSSQALQTGVAAVHAMDSKGLPVEPTMALVEHDLGEGLTIICVALLRLRTCWAQETLARSIKH